MKRYFYHGIEPDISLYETIEILITIIESGGIKRRNIINGIEDNELNHICLYKKNENYDYAAPDVLLDSARGGWIDNCMVFVISDEINARHIEPNVDTGGYGLKTNLVDEWRCFADIPLDKIIGIALPLDSISKALEGKNEFLYDEEIDILKNDLLKLKELCNKYGFKLFNSEEKDFVDKLDSQHPGNSQSKKSDSLKIEKIDGGEER